MQFPKAQDSLDILKTTKIKTMILKKCGKFFRVNTKINLKLLSFSTMILKSLKSKDRKCYFKYQKKCLKVIQNQKLTYFQDKARLEI